MNRVYKFRAWDCVEGEMYKVEGINFFFGLMELYKWVKNEDGNYTKANYNPGGGVPCVIDPEVKEGFELMQYTGINSVKGNEIYEGDIVLMKSVAPGGKDFVGTVTFDNGSYWLCNGIDAVLLFDELAELSILGDKYRSPELLDLKA